MVQLIDLPNGDVVEFPDDMSDEDIVKAIEGDLNKEVARNNAKDALFFGGKGLANAAGFLTNLVPNNPLKDARAIFDSEYSAKLDAEREAAKQQHYQGIQSGAENLMGAVGITPSSNPNPYVKNIAENVGSALPFLPFGAIAGLGGAVGGGAAAGAVEANDGSDTMKMLANIGGSFAGGGVANKAAQMVGAAPSATQLNAAKLMRGSADDAAQAAKNIQANNLDTTAALASQDPGLLALNKQAQALNPVGQVDNAGSSIQQQMDEIFGQFDDDKFTTSLRTMANKATDNFNNAMKSIVKEDDPYTASKTVYDELSSVYSKSKDVENQLWRSIDPDKTTRFNTAKLKNDILNKVSSRGKFRDQLPNDIVNKLDQLGDTESLETLQNLRSVVGNEWKSASTGLNPDLEKASLLNDVRTTIKDFINNAGPESFSSPEQLENYKKALDYTRSLKTMFGADNLKPLLKTNSSGNKVDPSQFLSKAIRPGTDDVQRLIDASGDSPVVRQAINDYMISKGVNNPEAFIAKQRTNLTPEMQSNLQQLGGLQQRVQQTQANPLVGKVLDNDTVTAISGLRRSADGPRKFNQILNDDDVVKNKDLLEQFHAGYKQSIINDSLKNGRIDGLRFSNIILDPSEQKILKTVIDDDNHVKAVSELAKTLQAMYTTSPGQLQKVPMGNKLGRMITKAIGVNPTQDVINSVNNKTAVLISQALTDKQLAVKLLNLDPDTETGKRVIQYLVRPSVAEQGE